MGSSVPTNGSQVTSELVKTHRTRDVVLVQMPWATTSTPNVGLAILSSLCAEEGLSCQTVYANMDLSAQIGFSLSGRFSSIRRLAGLSEHLFACQVFSPVELDSDAFIASEADHWNDPVPGQSAAEEDDDEPRFPATEVLRELRDSILPAFTLKLADRIVDLHPKIVGVGATFNQAMGGLALAKAIRARNPEIKLIFGGASFHQPMGQAYHRAVPELVDHVFLGEAEDSFRILLQRLKAGESLDGIPGTTWFESGVRHSDPQGIADLDQSPIPDYRDYHLEADRVQGETKKQFAMSQIPFETSRGCAWGMARACTFCGLDSNAFLVRAKSSDRVKREVRALSAANRLTAFTATDLSIPWRTMKSVLDACGDMDRDFEFFFEMRAGVPKRAFKRMKEGGIRTVQPGVESLSTDHLTLISKGTTLLDNVVFLKWCREFQIVAAYNLLHGFPGEQAAWFDSMTQLIPLIAHLDPPGGAPGVLEVHRYSVLYRRAEDDPNVELQARRGYTACFPPSTVPAEEIAYCFEDPWGAQEDQNSSDLARAIAEYRAAVGKWRTQASEPRRPRCSYKVGEGFVRIIDTRSRPAKSLVLTEELMAVLLLCDRVRTRRAVHGFLASTFTSANIDEAIEVLAEKGLLIEDNGKLLGIATGVGMRDSKALEDIVQEQLDAIGGADQLGEPMSLH